MLRMLWIGMLLVLTALSVANVAIPGHAADELDKQLLLQTPQILTKLKAAGIKNVGVLKFRVKKGTAPATDRAGSLNRLLSDKVELALILANDVKAPIGIIHNANKTASSINGASHLTAEGRRLLFTEKYDLAWGSEKVEPDAFITGVAYLAPDLKTMSVGLAMFDKEGGELVQLGKFDVRPDLEEILDSGESFMVRGAFDQGSLQLSEGDRKDKASGEAIETSLVVKKETSQKTDPSPSKAHPLSPNHPDAPVSLEVRYDGRPQTIEFREGAAFLREPNENQKIELIVRRKGVERPRLGIVLKVNGENTLYRQKQTDAQCAPWVFEPNLSEFGVQGFQIDQSTRQEFRVLSQGESKGKEIDYGEFVGTISITVFREQVVEPKISPDLLSEDGEDFAILTRGLFPAKPARNLSALRYQLADSSTRGLIVQGASVQSNVQLAQFKSDSIPAMSASVKYYNPQDLPE